MRIGNTISFIYLSIDLSFILGNRDFRQVYSNSWNDREDEK